MLHVTAIAAEKAAGRENEGTAGRAQAVSVARQRRRPKLTYCACKARHFSPNAEAFSGLSNARRSLASLSGQTTDVDRQGLRQA